MSRSCFREPNEILLAIVLLIPAFFLLRAAPCTGEDFPAIFNNEADKTAQPMNPEKAASTMMLPDGFKAKVFASEPDVRNPIAMAWDKRGRMWVAENYTYSDRSQHFDLSLRDRVIILHDTDGDGVADDRRVFTDNVQMLTSLEVGHGGVWLMCPPKMLFIPDANEDGIPDGPPKVVLDGFKVSKSNYHNFANGLRWGPDGWLYGRCGHSCPGNLGLPGTPEEQRVPIDGGMWRYHPKRQSVEVLCHGTVNPWGHDWDKNGELFYINTVIGHLWHVVPGAHFEESFGESLNPLVYERLDMIADHYHFDTAGTWQQSRDGAANSLGGGHAHIGMMIYQNDVWPATYRDRLFTLNMHGLRANVESIRRQGSGYVASHEPDFLISKDPFFRGIEINVGPDGQAYILDWSDTGECHDHTGVHRTSGRIFKIEYRGSKTSAIPFTKPRCMAGQGGLPKIWRAYQDGTLEVNELISLLSHSDEHIRVWGIRLLTDHWPLDTIHGPLPNVSYPDSPDVTRALMQAARRDDSGLVHLALASTLQRIPVDRRSELALELVRHARYAGDRNLPAMVWFGLMPLVEQRPRDLVEIARECLWPKTLMWITRGIASQSDEHPEYLDALLAAACEFPQQLQESVLAGMSQEFNGWLRVSKPKNWAKFSRGQVAKANSDSVRQLNVLFGDGRDVDELRNMVLDKKLRVKNRQAALETLIRAKPADLRNICEQVLDQRDLNAVAAKGLSTFDDPAVGRRMASMYRRFHVKDRPGLIEILVSRANFAEALLNQMRAEKNPIPAGDLSAFHARQILSFKKKRLSDKLAKVWGTIRDSPIDRQQLIDQWKTRLTPVALAGAQLGQGRLLFKKTCSQCHRLYGDGERVGPDLTGAQRSSLDYLLTNILDPNAAVGKDYRMTTVLLKDGRQLNGLVVTKNQKVVVLQTQNNQVTLSIEEISDISETQLSSMPQGLLTNLSADDVRNLVGYLMHSTQVPLPKESNR